MYLKDISENSDPAQYTAQPTTSKKSYKALTNVADGFNYKMLNPLTLQSFNKI